MKMPRNIKTPFQIIDEGGQWIGDVCADYTIDQSNYCVVGVIGGQGVGKSTIASLLASKDNSEILKDGPFVISPREIREAALYQTAGIDLFITPERMIILDTYPLLSIAHFTESSPFRDSKYERGLMENQSELHALQLILFLINICHSIIVVSDCGIDLNLCRLLLTAEMLRSDLAENVNPELPYLVFLNNRISVQELNRHVFRSNVELLNEMFSTSQYKITGVDAHRVELPHLRVKRPANLFLLPEIDADKPAAFSADRGFVDGKIPPIKCFVRSLTRQILGLRRSYPQKSGQSEKAWLQSASRAWNASKKSSLLSEFTQFVP
ncbi:DgyrCDS8446 [Dimorphilus gyrociliatus]|nr:DgyrCDS8446 [Dimorphilus gyrociliatus]